jgi:hypothetical protein
MASLEATIAKASDSSGRLATALNWLTAVAAFATVVLAVTAILEFLRKHP